jgi:hypothetical protein
MTDYLTNASKIYIEALKNMGLWVSWGFQQDDDNSIHLEMVLRDRVKEEAISVRQTRNARIARSALKEVAYLKMSENN